MSLHISAKGNDDVSNETKKLATFRLPRWVLDKLRGLDDGKSQAEAIEEALRFHRGWEPPSNDQ